MQIKALYIDGYKNLNGTNIEFSGSAIPIAVIGNNGTGKSNLIEALMHIFMGLYYGTPVDFFFRISYTAHGKVVDIHNDNMRRQYLIKVDGIEWSINRFKARARKPGQMPPFPAMIFGYYSGTCERLNKQFKRYRRTYASKLRIQSDDLERNFIFSSIDQAKYILLALFGHGHLDLLQEISMSGLEKVTISIKSPDEYKRNQDDPVTWALQGAYKEFISLLENLSDENLTKKEWVGIEKLDIWLYEIRHYVLDQERLEKVAYSLQKRKTNLYSLLHAFLTKGMLDDVKYTLRHSNQEIIDFEELSEGEKQLISVIGGLYLAQQDECLVLLDEPDTHLNPVWSWRYNRFLREALGESQKSTSCVLITTHDPVLISGLTKEQVLIAHEKDGSLTYEHPFRDPKGQGVANVLTSEFFGLPSSLDEETQGLLDERLRLSYKKGKLSKEDQLHLKDINTELEKLGLTVSFRDPLYKAAEEEKYKEVHLK